MACYCIRARHSRGLSLTMLLRVALPAGDVQPGGVLWGTPPTQGDGHGYLQWTRKPSKRYIPATELSESSHKALFKVEPDLLRSSHSWKVVAVLEDGPGAYMPRDIKSLILILTTAK